MLALFHPGHAWGAVAVRGGVAGGDVVGARQVVVRQDFQIKLVVVLVAFASWPRVLEERAANEEMGTGEYPFFWGFRETGFPLDGAVFLGIGFVPHFQ